MFARNPRMRILGILADVGGFPRLLKCGWLRTCFFFSLWNRQTNFFLLLLLFKRVNIGGVNKEFAYKPGRNTNHTDPGETPCGETPGSLCAYGPPPFRRSGLGVAVGTIKSEQKYIHFLFWQQSSLKLFRRVRLNFPNISNPPPEIVPKNIWLPKERSPYEGCSIKRPDTKFLFYCTRKIQLIKNK